MRGRQMLSPIATGNKWQMAFMFGSDYGVEEAQAMIDVLHCGAATTGQKVAEFEEAFARHEGAEHAVAANSWVGAAHLLTIALELKPTDEIIVPALTFDASANIFVREGAKVVLTEIDPRTFNIDPAGLEETITDRTRAIVAVHMCGQPCNMDAILEVARRNDLLVIQDAAHAPGAAYHGKKLGEVGDFAIYSFQQMKNMSTLGEGGMVITNDAALAEKMKEIRSHGGDRYFGINCRMPEVQGAVGLIQLNRLDGFNAIRRRLSYHLNELLADVEGIITPYEIPDVTHVYHLYNTLVDEMSLGMSRDEFTKALLEQENVHTMTQYHPTLNCLPKFSALGYKPGDCPVSEDASARVVTLPINPRFTDADMAELVEKIRRVLKR